MEFPNRSKYYYFDLEMDFYISESFPNEDELGKM